jgi:activator of HSP90 ATPase
MKTFKKYIFLPAPPEEVYLGLTKAQSIQLWTGAEVVFEEKVDSEFSLWDGDIVGKNLAFETDKKIVQQWYFGEDNEPSVVTIKLHPDKKGTSLEFVQTNIPDEDYDEFTEGIKEYFLGGLADFFEEEPY